MKIAVLGASGFVGYDFFRLIEDDPEWTPVIYSTSPKGLSNLARHDVALEMMPYDRLPDQHIEPDVEAIVNFSHPFTKRDRLEPEEQIKILVDWFGRARRERPGLKLIHISTMSVYEPFGGATLFEEDARLSPPSNDTYARNKVLFERLLGKLPAATEWQLLLRPTVVYGPFCRPWTDGPLRAFTEGDVAYPDLGGRIQPIFVRDISRVIRESLRNFQPGILNLPGPETMTWFDFLSFFERIAGSGRLVKDSQATGLSSKNGGPPVRPSRWGFYRDNTRKLVGDVVAHPNFLNMARRISRRCPRSMVRSVKRVLGADADNLPARLKEARVTTPPAKPGPYHKPFFAEDRLVSDKRLAERHSDLGLTRLEETAALLREYYSYRFTDRVFLRGDERPGELHGPTV